MITQEEQLLTGKLMHGKWYGKDETDPEKVMEYNLNIGREITQFTILKNGEKDDYYEYPTTGMHWFGNYLSSLDKYFIERATETEIIFGELKTIGLFNGDYKLRKVFKSVN